MIKLITDSSCDLPDDLVRQYDIRVLPMNITFDEETFLDQVELSTEAFYRRLADPKATPRTAYPTLGWLHRALEEELAAGNQVVIITIADALSGFYKASQVLLQEFAGKDIALFDSKSATMGQGVVVLAAARLIQAGKSFEEVVAAVPGIVERSRGYGVVNNLDYLRRGGRINGATAIVGTALNIKPVIVVQPDGSLAMESKVRGIQKGINLMVEKVKQDGLDFRDVTLFVGYIVQKENAEAMLAKMRQDMQLGEVILHEIGPTVGTHLGPGCIALFYLHPQAAGNDK